MDEFLNQTEPESLLPDSNPAANPVDEFESGQLGDELKASLWNRSRLAVFIGGIELGCQIGLRRKPSDLMHWGL